MNYLLLKHRNGITDTACAQICALLAGVRDYYEKEIHGIHFPIHAFLSINRYLFDC